MIQGLPFTVSSQTVLAPQAYGCSGLGSTGSTGFCVWGAGALPEPSGFPPPPPSGTSGIPMVSCTPVSIPQN